MNKIFKNVALAGILAFISLSFTTINGEKKEIKTQSSKVVWKGYKVTGSHQGTIALESGSLTFHQDELVDGEFTINMRSLVNTDLEGEYRGKLEGHLKSDDFFGVESYPTATLEFKKVKSTGKNSYHVSGNLTIKGKTNPISFDLSIYGNKASASIKIDRTEYDVRYGSSSFFDGLKDNAIYDEFDLVADIEF